MENQIYNIIGTMSGTSLDGLDLVHVRFEKNLKWHFKILNSKTYSYPKKWKNRLSETLHLTPQELEVLDLDFTNHLSDKILNFVSEFGIKNVDSIGSHGHTIFHQPDQGFTKQIGNRIELSVLTKSQVICDFRTQDVTLGGQGAPLVSIGDLLLFESHQACLNLGGFANLSIKTNKEIIAYDICAVNTVLNFLSTKINLDFDLAGGNAEKGNFISDFYNALEVLAYYKKMPPKSLGIEWINENIFDILNQFDSHSVEDLLYTYVTHIAHQITVNLKGIQSVLVTGGGAYNSFLIKQIQKQTATKIVLPEVELIDFKEALIFAFLAVLKLRGEVNCLSSVTGALRNHSSGKIFNSN